MSQNQPKTLVETLFVSITPRVVLVLFLVLALASLSKFLTKNKKISNSKFAFFAFAFLVSKDLIISMSEIFLQIVKSILEPMLLTAQKTGKNIDGIISSYKTIYNYNIAYFLALVIFIVIVFILKPKDENDTEDKDSITENKNNVEDKDSISANKNDVEDKDSITENKNDKFENKIENNFNSLNEKSAE